MTRLYWLSGLARAGHHAPCDLYSFRHRHLPLGLVWWRDR